jgi:hypothetical protein
LEIPEEKIRKLAHELAVQEVLEQLLMDEGEGFSEIFGSRGTYEGRRYLSKAFKKLHVPVHNLLGKFVMLASVLGYEKQNVLAA